MHKMSGGVLVVRALYEEESLLEVDEKSSNTPKHIANQTRVPGCIFIVTAINLLLICLTCSLWAAQTHFAPDEVNCSKQLSTYCKYKSANKVTTD
jgi:hypothetical protein